MSNIDASREIERLLVYGVNNGLLEESDKIFIRNSLLDLFRIRVPYHSSSIKEWLDTPTEILNNLLDYAVEKKIINNQIVYKDLFEAKVIGMLMPRQSEIIREFEYRLKNQSAEKATDYFYAISKASNYIRLDRIKNNLHWDVPNYNLKITINVSRPENSLKEIETSNLISESNYPKCLICIENVGYAGDEQHPARQNHRIIPIKLIGEQWYFQYSPYMYYNEHCILINENHIPMKISRKTFERLLAFVDQFPHYFMGSNADLPIVGGSILSHEHYQGGRHKFPLESAPIAASFYNLTYKSVNTYIIKWPMSVIRLIGMNKKDIASLANHILVKWQEYSDDKHEILAFTNNSKEKTYHNTITPIARKKISGEYEMDIVLRNNRINEKYPFGIFHSHEDLHHIKKENIGLIEAMGLAVLPGRLNEELKGIEEILTGNVDYRNINNNLNDSLHKHIKWIDELVIKYGVRCNKDKVRNIIREEVGYKFLKMLIDAGVYKQNKIGLEGFAKFMKYAGFKRK